MTVCKRPALHSVRGSIYFCDGLPQTRLEAKLGCNLPGNDNSHSRGVLSPPVSMPRGKTRRGSCSPKAPKALRRVPLTGEKFVDLTPWVERILDGFALLLIFLALYFALLVLP